MDESNDQAYILSVNFYCRYAGELDLKLELADEGKVEGLDYAWNNALEYYCPDNITQMKKQLKRKLGPIYSLQDQLELVLRFMNTDGKRDEIRVIAH